MPCIPLNGTTIYYEKEGSGQPVVFIHGYSSSHHLFEPQLEYFSRRCQVVVLDLRGNGRSGKLNVGIGDIVEKQCEDVRLLLESLDISQAVLVGSASGGLVAQRLAMLYPNLVNALILADSECGGSRPKGLYQIERLIEMASWFASFMPGEVYNRTLSAVYRDWATARRILKKDVQHHRPTESLKQRMAFDRMKGLHTDEARLILPVLCVVGQDNDWGLKQMQDIVRVFPWAQTAIIEDAIYPSHLCQPLAFNRIVLDFLRGNMDDSGGAASLRISGSG